MNKIYQLKFNTQTGTFVAISECQTVKSKVKRQKSSMKLVAALFSLAVATWAHSAVAASQNPPFTNSVNLTENHYSLDNQPIVKIDNDGSVEISHQGDLTLSSNVNTNNTFFSVIANNANNASSLRFHNDGAVTVTSTYSSDASDSKISFMTSRNGQEVKLEAQSWSINNQRMPMRFTDSHVNWHGDVNANWDTSASAMNLSRTNMTFHDPLRMTVNTNVDKQSWPEPAIIMVGYESTLDVKKGVQFSSPHPIVHPVFYVDSTATLTGPVSVDVAGMNPSSSFFTVNTGTLNLGVGNDDDTVVLSYRDPASNGVALNVQGTVNVKAKYSDFSNRSINPDKLLDTTMRKGTLTFYSGEHHLGNLYAESKPISTNSLEKTSSVIALKEGATLTVHGNAFFGKSQGFQTEKGSSVIFEKGYSSGANDVFNGDVKATLIESVSSVDNPRSNTKSYSHLKLLGTNNVVDKVSAQTYGIVEIGSKEDGATNHTMITQGIEVSPEGKVILNSGVQLGEHGSVILHGNDRHRYGMLELNQDFTIPTTLSVEAYAGVDISSGKSLTVKGKTTSVGSWAGDGSVVFEGGFSHNAWAFNVNGDVSFLKEGKDSNVVSDTWRFNLGSLNQNQQKGADLTINPSDSSDPVNVTVKGNANLGDVIVHGEKVIDDSESLDHDPGYQPSSHRNPKVVTVKFGTDENSETTINKSLVVEAKTNVEVNNLSGTGALTTTNHGSTTITGNNTVFEGPVTAKDKGEIALDGEGTYSDTVMITDRGVISVKPGNNLVGTTEVSHDGHLKLIPREGETGQSAYIENLQVNDAKVTLEKDGAVKIAKLNSTGDKTTITSEEGSSLTLGDVDVDDRSTLNLAGTTTLTGHWHIDENADKIALPGGLIVKGRNAMLKVSKALDFGSKGLIVQEGGRASIAALGQGFDHPIEAYHGSYVDIAEPFALNTTFGKMRSDGIEAGTPSIIRVHALEDAATIRVRDAKASKGGKIIFDLLARKSTLEGQFSSDLETDNPGEVQITMDYGFLRPQVDSSIDTLKGSFLALDIAKSDEPSQNPKREVRINNMAAQAYVPWVKSADFPNEPPVLRVDNVAMNSGFVIEPPPKDKHEPYRQPIVVLPEALANRARSVFKIDGFLKHTNVLGTPTCKDGLCTMEVGEMVTEMGTVAKSLLGVERTAYSVLTNPVSFIDHYGQARGLYAKVTIDNHSVGHNLPLSFESQQASFGGETPIFMASHPIYVGAQLSMQKGKAQVEAAPIDINFTSSRLEGYASTQVGAGVIASTNVGIEGLHIKANSPLIALEEDHRAFKWGVELSRPFTFANEVTLTPQAQLQYTMISAYDHSDAQRAFSQKRLTSMVARLGTRLDLPVTLRGKRINSWLDVSAYKEFKGQIVASGSDFSTKGEMRSVALRNRGVWFDLKAGASTHLSKSLEASIDLGSRFGWKRGGFVMNLDMKYHF